MSEPAVRSARFRTPNPHERACGLWVDRMGWQREARLAVPNSRVLGLYAFVAVEEGVGEMVTTRHGRFSVVTGDVMLVLPEEPTGYHPTGSGWLQRWIVWGGPAATALGSLAGLATLRPVVGRAGDAVARAYLQLRDRMADESLEAAIERDAAVRAMVAQVLGVARRGGLSEAQSGALDRVLALIDHEPETSLSLPTLARCAGLSETHLRRLFVARMGVAPHAFITARRIGRAKALLAEGMRTSDVAEACGFDDVGYFRRVFRQVTGGTPGRWRAGAGAT